MKTRELSKTEQDIFGSNLALILSWEDANAATTATAVESLSVLAGTKVQVVGARLITTFGGGGASLQVSLGWGGTGDALCGAFEVSADGTYIAYYAGGNAWVPLVADTVDVFWTGLDLTYTSGKLVFYLAVNDLNKLPKT